jgi:dolichol-phosphate mannosyltransferase
VLSVVVPCRDEEANVARFAAELLPHIPAPFEVVAVDDGSKDGTAAALAALGVKVVRHLEGRGLGAALRSGFAAASGDWIVTLDADLTFDPKDIVKLLGRQELTGADLVAGSPFLSPDGLAEVPWARRAPSLVVNAFYRGLVSRSFSSYTPIFRLYRASCLKDLELRSDGFEINAEIAALFVKRDFKLAEVPCRLTTRREGSSKLSGLKELARHARLAARLLAQ